MSDFKKLEAAARERGWTIMVLFPIYRLGWEMDNAGLVAKDAVGKMHTITTNHGGLRIDEDTIGDLKRYLSQATTWKDKMQAAVEYMEMDDGQG